MSAMRWLTVVLALVALGGGLTRPLAPAIAGAVPAAAGKAGGRVAGAPRSEGKVSGTGRHVPGGRIGGR